MSILDSSQDFNSVLSQAKQPPRPKSDLSQLQQIQSEQAEADKKTSAAADKLLAGVDQEKKILDKSSSGLESASKLLDQVQEWKPQPPKQDPIKAFGTFGSAFTIMAAALTKRPMVNAFNAAAAIATSQKAGDDEAYDKAFAAWKENMQIAFKKHDAMMEDYRTAREFAKDDIDLLKTQYEINAKKWQDPIAEKLLFLGKYEELEKLNLERARVGSELQKTALELSERKFENDLTKSSLADFQKKNGRAPTPQEAATLVGEIKRDLSGASIPQTVAGQEYQNIVDKMKAYKASHPAASDAEARDAALKEYRGDKADAGTAGSALSETSLRRLASQWIDGDRTAVQSALGYSNSKAGQLNRKNFNEMIDRIAEERHLTPEQIAGKKAEFVGLERQEGALGQRAGAVAILTEEFDPAADIALQASGAVKRTEYKSLNAIEQAVKAGSGNKEIIAFNDANQTLANVYSRLFSPQQSDDARHAALAILDTAYSEGQYETGIAQLEKEIKIAQAAPDLARERIQKYLAGQNSPQQPPARATTPAGGPPATPSRLNGRDLQYSPSQNKFRDKKTGEIFNADGTPG